MYRDTTVPVDCMGCGKEFRPNKPAQIYCSKSCRMAKYRKLGPRIERLCPLCGTAFTPNHSSRIYCSKGCYIKHRTALYLPGSIRPTIMEAIMERDSYKCQDCGVDIPKVRDKYNHGHLHHITSLLSCGADYPANIVLLCSKCHSQRHKLDREAHTRSNKASKILDET